MESPNETNKNDKGYWHWVIPVPLLFGKHGHFYNKNFFKTQNGKEDWKFHILDQWHWAQGLSRDIKKHSEWHQGTSDDHPFLVWEA